MNTQFDPIAAMKACGGTPLMTGGQKVWDFGWRKSDPETTALCCEPFRAADEGVIALTGDKVFLWEFVKQCNGGKNAAYNWQLTGSCVNGGGQNAATTRTAVEVVNLGQPEVFKTPFTLHAYGYSRHLYGWESQGEGSMGDGMARALREVGVTTIDDPSVPKPTVYENCLVYTSATELKFSAWKNAPQALRDAAKPHPFQFGIVQTPDEAEAELRKGRPLTWAGDWGGKMSCGYKGTGDNKVLWNGGRSDTWNHQQSCHGVWHHPDLGRIWFILNQWYQGNGQPVHGKVTQGEPAGGYWVADADMEYQCRTGEVRSLKDFSGFTNGLISFANV